ncbi:MAG: hypothetical protein D4R64_08365 [Porphyromonadaceae bacterium]|nr:MAG: hypothetical protein D4R64_08365 [Porphyromonadaceae bacterium]
MKKENLLLFLIISAQFLAILFISHKSKENLKKCYNLEREKIIAKNEIDLHETQFKKQLFSENKLLKNFTLTDLNNNSIEIGRLINSPKLIYRFPSQSCIECVKADVSYLRLLGKSIGFQNIIIISEFGQIRDLRIFNNQIGRQFYCFNYKGKFDISLESESNVKDFPFIFLLDNNLRINLAFLTYDFEELTKAYFSRIEEFFMSEGINLN